MKKYFAILLVVTSGIVYTSCSDSLLDPDQSGLLTASTSIKSSADLVYLLNTSYGFLKNTSEISFNSVYTDEAAIGFANGGQGIGDDATWTMTPVQASPNGIWDGYYEAMAYINRVIKFSSNVTPVDDADQQLINKTLAEAYTLRAYCHNQLLSYFTTNPKDMSALGVILDVDVYPADYKGSRVSNGEVYAQIDSDLATAASLYASVPASVSSDVYYANRNFTTALMARTYALRGDYTNALPAAQNVINSGISLATFSQYLSVFHTDTNAATVETIFKLKNGVNGVKIGAIWASVNPTVNGSPFFEVGRSLFNALNTTSQPSAMAVSVTGINAPNTLVIPGNTLQVNDMISFAHSVPENDFTNNGTSTTPVANGLLGGKVYFVKTVNGDNVTLTDTANGTTNINLTGAANNFVPVDGMANAGDIRYAAIVHPTSIISANYLAESDFLNHDKLAFRKYPGTSANGQLTNDFKICRISEMYLIKAEALISAGDLDGAAATIKQIRDARFNKPQAQPSYASATDAWKDVLYERQKELAAEGFRFVDLKRLGQLAGMTELDRDTKDCQLANGACSLPFSDHRWTLPIPTDETNPNPSIQQNPGY